MKTFFYLFNNGDPDEIPHCALLQSKKDGTQNETGKLVVIEHYFVLMGPEYVWI